MGLRRIRDPRLSTEQNQTNILGGQEGQQQQSGGGISGTPEEGPGASDQVTTDAGQAQQQTQTQQQTNQATKAPTTPSRSGMFTNIKSYLEKNKPVVQQMGQQAGRQFASTAEKVRQEAASRAKTYGEALGKTEQDVQSQIGAGREAVDVAVGPQPTQQTEATQPATETAEAEQPTLAQYAQRAQETAQQAQELNLQEQAREAARLQQQASGIVSDAGRQDLLRDVFGRRSRQYSTGAQALDQLLLSQSPQAAQQLQETVQRSSKGLEDISRDQQAAQNRLQALRALGAGAGEQLEKYGLGTLEGEETGLDTKLEEYLSRRSGLLGEDLSGVVSELESKRGSALQTLGVGEDYDPENWSQNLQTLAGLLKGENLWRRGEDVFGDLASGKYYNLEPVKKTLGMTSYDTMERAYKDLSEFDRNTLLARVNEDQLKKAVGNIIDRINIQKGLEGTVPVYTADDFIKDMWKGSQSSSKAKEDQFFTMGALADAYKNLVQSYQDIDPESLIKQRIAKETGTSYEDLLAGKDVDKYDIASKEELNAINRLNRLLGKSEVAPETVQEGLKESPNIIKNILKEYGYGQRPVNTDYLKLK